MHFIYVIYIYKTKNLMYVYMICPQMKQNIWAFFFNFEIKKIKKKHPSDSFPLK